ncbi:hypothetical protein [Roseateles sp.]|uniref:hypothetical protein n=1 Tax=Roseateles sp. TaxID=1971397 RepID=UPI003BA74CE0
MNTTASTSTESTVSTHSTGFELPQPASVSSLDAGFARLVMRARQATGLTEAGLFWVSYVGLLGLIALAALA